MKVIALSGPRSHVITAEDAIKQLDVPSAARKDIDLTVYFVVASDQSSPNPLGNPIPADLESTIATLKTTFPFKNYALLDVLSLRSRSGVSASTSGVLGGNRITQFSVNSATLEPDSMIRLDHVRAGFRNPVPTDKGQFTYVDAGISTDVMDVKEGQKLVVGRSSMPDRALFLVLIAKTAE